MMKLVKTGSIFFFVCTWMCISVFFVDSTNIIDILFSDELIVSHPNDDTNDNDQNDEIAERNTSNSDFSFFGHVLSEFNLKLQKKILVDVDSISTEPIIDIYEKIPSIFEKTKTSLYSYSLIQISLFLKNCSLII